MISVNQDSIIFLDSDKDNNFHTIAFNWDTFDIIAIYPIQYQILNFVTKHTPSQDRLLEVFPDQNQTIKELISNSILIENESNP